MEFSPNPVTKHLGSGFCNVLADALAESKHSLMASLGFASYEIPDMIVSKYKEKKFFDKKKSLEEIFKKEINEITK